MLDNTIVIVLSDNGMPFPRVKGQMYEQDFHLPMALMWKNGVSSGITMQELISYTDIAPTILDACGLPMHEQMTGKSFLPRILNRNYEENQYVYMCKERHDNGIKEEMRTALLLEMERTEDPCFYGKADFFDKCAFYGKGHHTWNHYVNGDFKYPDE